MKYSKLSTIFSIIPIIVTIIWVILSMYIFTFTERRTYISYFGLVCLVTIILGCIYSIIALREKNSIYKIIGITLSGIYILIVLLMMIMNAIDIYNFANPD
jgi:hypothetical protein